MGQAVVEGRVSSSPCHIPGAGRASRQRRIEPASLPELAAIVEGMPERLRLLVVLGAWCALRYGELAELRRHDVDLERGALSISRAVVRVDGADLVGRPRSVEGVRHVAIPPHPYPAIQAHLDAHVARRSDSLLFPRPGTNRHLIHTEVTKIVMTARAAAGRPDLRLHDLRHTGAVLAAQTGATIPARGRWARRPDRRPALGDGAPVGAQWQFRCGRRRHPGHAASCAGPKHALQELFTHFPTTRRDRQPGPCLGTMPLTSTHSRRPEPRKAQLPSTAHSMHSGSRVVSVMRNRTMSG